MGKTRMIDISNDEQFFKRVSDVHLVGYSDFDIGNAIREIYYYKEYISICQSGFLSFWKFFFRQFKYNTFHSFLKTEKKGKGSICFFYSKYGYRKDMIPWYNAICELCNNTVVSTPDDQSHFRIKGLMPCCLYFVWVIQYYMSGMSWGLSRAVAMFVYYAVLEYEDAVSNISWKNTKLVTLFCDRHPSENLVVQKAEKMGVKTATLQHGMFRPGVFRWTDCDFFLGFGIHEKENLELSDPLSKTKFVSVGYPKLLVEERLPDKMRDRMNKDCFGILLTGVSQEDKMLLELGFGLAKEFGLKVNIRSHPGYRYTDYKPEWKNLMKSEPDQDVTLNEFLDSSYFFLIGASTVFMECILRLIPCFHYKGVNDPYRKVDWCSFGNYEELSQVYHKFEKSLDNFESEMRNARDYYCEPGNVSDNYYRFFSDFDN